MARINPTRPIKIPIAKPVPFKVAKLKITPIVGHAARPDTMRFERMAKSLGGAMQEKRPGRHGRY